MRLIPVWLQGIASLANLSDRQVVIVVAVGWRRSGELIIARSFGFVCALPHTTGESDSNGNLTSLLTERR
jgi:hypothetical protein